MKRLRKVMSMDIHEHYQKMCAGYVTSWISRPKQPLTTVAKSIETISLKKGISQAEFTNAVQEIRRLSVDTFGPERHWSTEEASEAVGGRLSIGHRAWFRRRGPSGVGTRRGDPEGLALFLASCRRFLVGSPAVTPPLPGCSL